MGVVHQAVVAPVASMEEVEAELVVALQRRVHTSVA
jgi:hypothetical protein